MEPASKSVILLQKSIPGQSRRESRLDSMTVEQNLPILNDSTYTSYLAGGTTQAPTPPDNNKMRISDEGLPRQNKSFKQDESEKAMD